MSTLQSMSCRPSRHRDVRASADNHLNRDTTFVESQSTWLSRWRKIVVEINKDEYSKRRVIYDILNEPDAQVGFTCVGRHSVAACAGSGLLVNNLGFSAVMKVRCLLDLEFSPSGCTVSARVMLHRS